MTNNPAQGIDISNNMEVEWGPHLYTAYIFQIQCLIGELKIEGSSF